MDNVKSQRYIAGLDGLRALAMFFIIAYHFSFSWAGGGFLGVDIFFVLSGYLVTSKILSSKENELDFNLKKFWGMRIRRLLPAAYAMIITSILWVILFNRELLGKLWGDVISSIFYTTNWWFIFHKLSYFDSFGLPSPLKHLWFLAVQEQFFFVWPIVLIMGLRYFKKREKFSFVVFILSLGSSLLMGILYNPEIDPSRIYYGTDTRSFELLIGSFLAFVLPMEKLLSEKISVMQRNALNITSIITLAVFILSAIFVDEYQPFIYRGGIFLFSLNTAVLIVCICQPSGFLGNMLSWKPLRWIGTRSYGIYLWHYPIMVLSTPIYEIGNPVYWRVSLQLTITCIIAELSYRFIETPIRELGVIGFYRKYSSLSFSKWEGLTLARKLAVIMVVSMIVVLTIGINSIAKTEKKVKETETYQTERIVSSTGQAVSAKDSKTNSSPRNKSYKAVLAIGDSIMLDIAPSLRKKYTNITIDGKVSRQMSAAVKLAPKYAKFNNADKAVIIELGTNGYITDKQIDSLLNSFSKAHIYSVNTRVPRRWEKTVNKILKEKAEERENVILIDWYSIAVKHPEYFGHDGVHLTPSGAKALTNLISVALNSKK